MKLILSVILIALFGVVGYGISSHYISRKKFFFALTNFLNLLKSDISFSTKNQLSIIDSYLSQKINQDFKTLLQNYKNIILEKKELGETNLFRSISILTLQEKDSILNFFKTLGRVDVFNQKEIIDKFYQTTNSYLQSASNESKKYSSLYTKLGIILGAFVALIIL